MMANGAAEKVRKCGGKKYPQRDKGGGISFADYFFIVTLDYAFLQTSKLQKMRKD